VAEVCLATPGLALAAVLLRSAADAAPRARALSATSSRDLDAKLRQSVVLGAGRACTDGGRPPRALLSALALRLQHLRSRTAAQSALLLLKHRG